MVSRSRKLALLLALIVLKTHAQIGEMNTPSERGKYEGTSRVGVWEYRDTPGRVSLKVDYTNQRLVYIKPDTSDFVVRENNQWVKGKLDIPCRFHGTQTLLHSHYQSFKFPSSILDKRKPVSVFLTFEVNENGSAENPEVVNSPNSKVKAQLLKLFNSAPNSWIVGIKEDGNAVRCKMALEFSYYDYLHDNPDEVLDRAGVKAKVLMRYRVLLRRSPIRQNVPALGMFNESRGVQFSPDDSKILVDESSIIDLQSKQVYTLPFENVHGSTWLDENQIIFKYQYKNWPSVAAIFDLSSGDVTAMSDSVTYFHVATKPPGLLSFAQNSKEGLTLWQQSTSTLQAKRLMSNVYVPTIPVAWSPDTVKILLRETEHGFNKFIVYDSKSKDRTILPVYNTAYSGWSKDGTCVYLLQQEPKGYSGQPVGRVFRYNIETDELMLITEDIKELRQAVYNAADNILLLQIKDDVYRYDMALHTPSLLVGNAYNISLSNNGLIMTYMTRENKQVHLSAYNIKNAVSERLKSWDVKK